MATAKLEARGEEETFVLVARVEVAWIVLTAALTYTVVIDEGDVDGGRRIVVMHAVERRATSAGAAVASDMPWRRSWPIVIAAARGGAVQAGAVWVIHRTTDDPGSSYNAMSSVAIETTSACVVAFGAVVALRLVGPAADDVNRKRPLERFVQSVR